MWTPLKMLRRSKEPADDGTTAEQRFWRWFLSYEAKLHDFEEDRNPRFDRLSKELKKVDRELCFEFGPPQTRDGREMREFVISAGGIKPSFPAVVKLAGAAPPLTRFHVTAFRPRRPPQNTVECGGLTVDPADVQVSLLSNGEKAGLHLFLPGDPEREKGLKVIGYLLLDEALGEFDVETSVGFIGMYPLKKPVEFERMPLAELPAKFDQLVAQLEGRSGLPS